MRVTCLVLILFAACKKKDDVAPAAPPDAAPSNKVPLPLAERPLGPTRPACEAMTGHLKTLLLEKAAPSAQTPEQQAYSKTLLEKFTPLGVAYCLQVASPKEVECLTAAKTSDELSTCERFRREIPADLLERNEVVLSDCELVFDRLRQFKIEEEGAAPLEIDETRDQIVRSCVEKAKVGTIACFVASKTYAQARHCP